MKHIRTKTAIAYLFVAMCLPACLGSDDDEYLMPTSNTLSPDPTPPPPPAGAVRASVHQVCVEHDRQDSSLLTVRLYVAREGGNPDSWEGYDVRVQAIGPGGATFDNLGPATDFTSRYGKATTKIRIDRFGDYTFRVMSVNDPSGNDVPLVDDGALNFTFLVDDLEYCKGG